MKLLTLALTAAAALTVAGCAYDTDHRGSSVQIEPSHNLLGLVKTSPGSYVPNDNALVNVSSTELWARRDFSGNNVTFLWGAISVSDY